MGARGSTGLMIRVRTPRTCAGRICTAAAALSIATYMLATSGSPATASATTATASGSDLQAVSSQLAAIALQLQQSAESSQASSYGGVYIDVPSDQVTVSLTAAPSQQVLATADSNSSSASISFTMVSYSMDQLVAAENELVAEEPSF